MEVLPSKTVSERRSFSVNFGDELPWGSVITGVRLAVRVFSGVDPSPQKIFARVISITGPEVLFQVKQGLPGVTYALTLRVAVGATWYEREMLLSVLTDKADTGPLFPVALSVTSTPYAQLFVSPIIGAMRPYEGGTIKLVVKHGTVQSDYVNSVMVPAGGSIFLPIVPVVVEDAIIDVGFIPIAGTITLARVPINVVESAIGSMIPMNGTITSVVKGFVVDSISGSMIPMNGTIYIP